VEFYRAAGRIAVQFIYNLTIWWRIDKFAPSNSSAAMQEIPFLTGAGILNFATPDFVEATWDRTDF